MITKQECMDAIRDALTPSEICAAMAQINQGVSGPALVKTAESIMSKYKSIRQAAGLVVFICNGDFEFIEGETPRIERTAGGLMSRDEKTGELFDRMTIGEAAKLARECICDLSEKSQAQNEGAE